MCATGNLTKLTNLNLDRNRLEFLPTEIGNLVNLGVLSLRENRLLELPAEIGNCRELHVLDVCGNKLQHLPFSLTSINLKVFTLLEVTGTSVSDPYRYSESGSGSWRAKIDHKSRKN